MGLRPSKRQEKKTIRSPIKKSRYPIDRCGSIADVMVFWSFSRSLYHLSPSKKLKHYLFTVLYHFEKKNRYFLCISLDHRGTVLFAFHGSVNKSLRPNEAGDYHGETRSKSRNEWVYENTRYHFQRGDVLNFWVYVQNGDLGYVLENQQYTYPGLETFNRILCIFKECI